MLILITFFESPLFPTMFGIILRGQGKHTKFAAAALIMGEAGGAIWPSIAFAVDEGNSLSSLIVTVVLWGIALLWSGMLSSTRVTRRWVDPKWSRQRVATGDHRHGATVGPGSADFHTVSERPMAVTSPADSSGRPRQPTLSTVT